MFSMFGASVWWRLLVILLCISYPVLSYRLFPVCPSSAGVQRRTTSWLGVHQVPYMKMKDLSLSAKCELYRQIYPKAGKCIILSRDESEKLLIALSEQFDLKVVDNNFAAFLAAESNHKSNKQIVMEIYRNLNKTRPLIHNQIPGFYEYDQLHYRWTITPSVVSIPKKGLLSGMKIQLSNNRFLYKPAEECPLKGLTSVGRHKSPNW